MIFSIRKGLKAYYAKTMVERTNSVRMNGGRKLVGSVGVQGSKNTALPVLAAAVLSDKTVILRNLPDISDVRSMLEILEFLGAKYTFKENVLKFDGSQIENKIITDELSSKLRASSLLLGPLLSRFGSCAVGMPGGCSIGPRPLNYHFDGFEHLGAAVTIQEGIVRATSEDVNGEYTLEFPSVGATQNLINAAVFGSGKTLIHNIATEPEVMGLIEFLNNSGANVKIFEGNSVEIIGVDRLKSVEYMIPFDRIEAITLLVAGAASKGDVTVTGACPKEMTSVLQKFEDMGLVVETKENSIRVKYDGALKGVNIRTGVHPAFPTDAQAQFSVLMTRADSFSILTETIFNNRFHHLEEMKRMSAEITIESNIAIIYPSQLSACRVKGHELRGTASMIIAGLVAKGSTRVDGLENMYRGYEAFVEKLEYLGAEIYYVD